MKSQQLLTVGVTLKFLLLVTLTTIASSMQAQVKDSTIQKSHTFKRSVCLLAGYSLGRYSYAEIGVAKLSSANDGYHPLWSFCFASTEIKLRDKLIVGPKIGVWMTGGAGAMTIGLNMIYYTSFHDGSLVFRPEIGFGMENFKLVYGYDAHLTTNRLSSINKNLVGLTCCFKVRRLKEVVRPRKRK